MYSISYAGVSIGCVVGGFSLYIAREIAEFKGEEAKKSLKTYIIGIICVTVLISTWLGITMGDYIREGDYSKYSCRSLYCKNPASYHVHSFDMDIYYCDEHAEEAYEDYNSHTNQNANKTASSKKDDYGHDMYDALAIAEKAVKEKLKSPATAVFCKSSEYTVSCVGNTWTISGYVDAQNSFGATLRNTFNVKITFSGSNKYTVDSCRIT